MDNTNKLTQKSMTALALSCAFSGAVGSINPSEALQSYLDESLGTTPSSVEKLEGDQASYCGAAGLIGAGAGILIPGAVGLKVMKSFMLSTRIPTGVKVATSAAVTAYVAEESIRNKYQTTKDILGLGQ